MRYRLMASYLGASYQAAVGPSDRDVTLFAAPPPPEGHGFSPVPGGGIWRKQVRLDDLDGLWESRPIGSYHGEPCLVLDDLGDRLHIVYLGMDERRAGQLGYWQVDRGVFEVVVQRHEVTDLAEERHEFPIACCFPRCRGRWPSATGAGNGGRFHGRFQFGGPARAGPGNGGSGIGRIALPSGGQGASVVGEISSWNGQPASETRQLPVAQAQQQPSGPQQPITGQQQPMQPAGQTSMQQQPVQQQPMQQPVGAGGQQQMTGGYDSQPPMAQNAVGAPGGATASATPTGSSRPLVLSCRGAAGAVVARRCPSPPTRRPAFRRAHHPRGRRPRTSSSAEFNRPPAQPGFAGQSGFTGQAGFAAQAGAAGQQYSGAAMATGQQAGAAPQQSGGVPQLPNAQPPAAVAAWHGSPVPDGNGTWYYQPTSARRTDSDRTWPAERAWAERRQARRMRSDRTSVRKTERRRTGSHRPQPAERVGPERGHAGGPRANGTGPNGADGAERDLPGRIRPARAQRAVGGPVGRGDGSPVGIAAVRTADPVIS